MYKRQENALALSRDAERAGADGLLLVTPYYNKASQAGLIRHFQVIADGVDVPLILYDVPSRTGVTIAPETYAELAKHPNINGVKEAGGNFSNIQKTRNPVSYTHLIDFGEKEPGPDGCDAVRFLMSANAGEDLKPIARIASGGELARIMLALKNVLAEQESIGTLVFDEVDTGVSGRAAQKVAEKLAQVSRRKQVLCVTHLPQLAAMADTHFSVEKGERDGQMCIRDSH